MYSPAAVGHINPRAANAMALTLWGSFVAKNGLVYLGPSCSLEIKLSLEPSKLDLVPG